MEHTYLGKLFGTYMGKLFGTYMGKLFGTYIGKNTYMVKEKQNIRLLILDAVRITRLSGINIIPSLFIQ